MRLRAVSTDEDLLIPLGRGVPGYLEEFLRQTVLDGRFNRAVCQREAAVDMAFAVSILGPQMNYLAKGKQSQQPTTLRTSMMHGHDWHCTRSPSSSAIRIESTSSGVVPQSDSTCAIASTAFKQARTEEDSVSRYAARGDDEFNQETRTR